MFVYRRRRHRQHKRTNTEMADEWLRLSTNRTYSRGTGHDPTGSQHGLRDDDDDLPWTLVGSRGTIFMDINCVFVFLSIMGISTELLFLPILLI